MSCASFSASTNFGQKNKQANDQKHTEPYLKVHWHIGYVRECISSSQQPQILILMLDMQMCSFAACQFDSFTTRDVAPTLSDNEVSELPLFDLLFTFFWFNSSVFITTSAPSCREFAIVLQIKWTFRWGNGSMIF